MKRILLLFTVLATSQLALAQWSTSSNPTLPFGQIANMGGSAGSAALSINSNNVTNLYLQRSGNAYYAGTRAKIGISGGRGLDLSVSDNSGTSFDTKLVLDALNDGLAINTNAATAVLDINGDLRIRDIPFGSHDSVLVVDNNGYVYKRAYSGSGSNDTDWHKVGTSTAPASLSDDIRTNGLVGIGMDPITSFGGTNNITLSVSGNTYTSGGSFVGSDACFKRNIQTIENAMDIIGNLEGVRYDFRTEEFGSYHFPENKVAGLIAQNVRQVFPEAVEKMDDGYYAVNYDMLIPVLIEAIKEQSEEIESLKRQLASSSGQRSGQVHNVGSNVKEVNALHQNRPNPFSEKTIIDIEIGENITHAKLLITNLNGQMVKEILISERGNLQLEISAYELSSGIYNYTLLVDDILLDTKKMVLTK